MEITYEMLFAIGNLLFLTASIPNITAAIKNRNSLKGFSFAGALLTFLGMDVSILGYIVMISPLNILLALPTTAYWGLVTWYNRSPSLELLDDEIKETFGIL